MTLKQYLQKNGITCSVAEFISAIKPCRQTVNKDFKLDPSYIDGHIEDYKRIQREGK